MSTAIAEAKACAKCAYWEEATSHCHRHAPVSVTFKVDEKTEYQTQFPVTQADDWCGDFAAK